MTRGSLNSACAPPEHPLQRQSGRHLKSEDSKQRPLRYHPFRVAAERDLAKSEHLTQARITPEGANPLRKRFYLLITVYG